MNQCHELNGFPNDSAPGGVVLPAGTSSVYDIARESMS